MERIERELRALIERHRIAQVEQYGLRDAIGYAVSVPELLNILEPGSAPMYAADFGHSATCGTCLPDGDGTHYYRGDSRRVGRAKRQAEGYVAPCLCPDCQSVT